MGRLTVGMVSKQTVAIGMATVVAVQIRRKLGLRIQIDALVDDDEQ